MAYTGFVGSGTVGHFYSTTTLEALYPAATHAGREATVEITTGSATHYFSDGASWKAVPTYATDSSSNVTGLVGTGGGKFAVGDPSLAIVRAMIAEGLYSPTISVLGDSTGTSASMWVYKLAQRFAADYPNLRVQYELFDNGTAQDYVAPVVIQAGTGERRIRFNGSTGGSHGRYQSAADVGNWTTDLDVSAKLSMDSWSTATQQAIVSRFAFTSGLYSFLFYQAFNTLRLDLSVNGTSTPPTVLSTANLASLGTTFADGTTNWVRFTYTASDGSVRFYTSPANDGVTWTQLGTAVSSTVTGPLYAPATKDYEIGSCNGLASSGAGASQVLNGNIYSVRIRNGINGPIMNADPIEAWQYANGDGTSLAGAQTLYIVNGSIAGATLTYLSDTTRSKMLLRNVQASVVIMSCSHNDTAALGVLSLKTPWDSFLALLKARAPEASFALITQNPKIAPALFIEAHGNRLKRLVSWAKNNSVAVIDTYTPFVTGGASNYIDPADGVHPTAAGGVLQAATIYAAFQ